MRAFLFLLILVVISQKTMAQNVGIGTPVPKARLHVTDSSVLFSTGDPFLSATPNTPVSGSGARMLWYAGKASFRTGMVDSDQWDKDNIGFFSFASGYSTRASNIYTTALGRNTIASGSSATAMGYFTNASGNNSTALGAYTIASGDDATAMGSNTLAAGLGSTSFGFATIARGNYSNAFGSYTKSLSANSVVVGIYNDTTNTNRLFEVGSGTAETDRKNAITVINNGNTGMGTTNPLARLHVAEGAVLFQGAADADPFTFIGPPVSGQGVRMMWYPQKAAFRVGTGGVNSWAKDNIGLNSFASGFDTRASGVYSTSMGYQNNASGYYSFAVGQGNTVSQSSSMALGSGNMVTGPSATALGGTNTAEGSFSFTAGNGNRSSGYNSVSIGFNCVSWGQFSTTIGEANETFGNYSMALGYNAKSRNTHSIALGLNLVSKASAGIVLGQFNDSSDNLVMASEANSDRIFQLGNGTASNRKNAITVLRNGHVGIGALAPSNQLEVVGGPNGAPITLMIANRGGFGPGSVEFVSDYGTGSQWRPGYIRSNDGGNFTGILQFYTNGVGPLQLNTSVKSLELRNGFAFTASGTVSSFSDSRIKKDVTDFKDGLNVVLQLRPVSFLYTDSAPFNNDQQQIGIIAQELETLAPYMVEKNAQNGYSDLRSVNNQAYIFLLINAIKEQEQKISSQQQQLNNQQEQINELKKLIEASIPPKK